MQSESILFVGPASSTPTPPRPPLFALPVTARSTRRLRSRQPRAIRLPKATITWHLHGTHLCSCRRCCRGVLSTFGSSFFTTANFFGCIVRRIDWHMRHDHGRLRRGGRHHFGGALHGQHGVSATGVAGALLRDQTGGRRRSGALMSYARERTGITLALTRIHESLENGRAGTCSSRKALLGLPPLPLV